MDQRKIIYVALLVLLCLLIVKLEYHGPSTTFDDTSYILGAKQILNGSFNMSSSPYYYGFLLPETIAASFKLLGETNFAAAVPAVIEYIFLILLIFLCSCNIFKNREVSLTLAASAAVSGFIAIYSSRVLPDMPIAVLVATCSYLLIKEKPLLAGLVAGLIIYFRLGSFFIPAFLLLGVLLWKRKFALKFLVGAMIMTAIFFLIIPIHLSSLSNYSANQVKLSVSNIRINLYEMVYVIPFGYGASTTQVFQLGLLLLLAALSAFIILYWPKKDPTAWNRLGFLIITFLLTYFYLFLGSEGYTKYVLITVITRYFLDIALPITLVAGYAVFKISFWIVKKYGLTAAYLFLILVFILVLLSNVNLLIYFHNNIVDYTKLVSLSTL